MVHASKMSNINVRPFEDELWQDLDEETSISLAWDIKRRTRIIWRIGQVI